MSKRKKKKNKPTSGNQQASQISSPKRSGFTKGIAAVLLLVVASLGFVAFRSNGLTHYEFEVVAKYPHDPKAFSQGLFFLDGHLYESTGVRGESSLRLVNPEDGVVIKKVDLANRFFGEGIAHHNGKIVQLTYQENRAFIYDLKTFKRLGTFSYSTEGWGLTHDGTRFIMSDGTDTLYFRNSDTFKVEKTVRVRELGHPVSKINELEYIDGEIWANIWQKRKIIRISPSGKVLGYLDLSNLMSGEDRNGTEDSLNGIAYDEENNRIFLTGKRYSYVYEIRIL